MNVFIWKIKDMYWGGGFMLFQHYPLVDGVQMTTFYCAAILECHAQTRHPTPVTVYRLQTQGRPVNVLSPQLPFIRSQVWSNWGMTTDWPPIKHHILTTLLLRYLWDLFAIYNCDKHYYVNFNRYLVTVKPSEEFDRTLDMSGRDTQWPYRMNIYACIINI